MVARAFLIAAVLWLAALVCGSPVHAQTSGQGGIQLLSKQLVSSNKLGTTAVASITYLGAASNESGLASNDFTSFSLTGPLSGRHIIVAIAGRTGSTGTSISSVSVCGVTATNVVTSIIAGSGSGQNAAAMYIVPQALSTSCTINVTWSAAYARTGIAVYAVYGLSSATATATGNSSASSPTASLNISAGGIAVGSCFTQSATVFTWTNLTESLDFTGGSFTNTYSAAAAAFAAAQTSLALTCAPSSATAPVGVFAAFK